MVVGSQAPPQPLTFPLLSPITTYIALVARVPLTPGAHPGPTPGRMNPYCEALSIVRTPSLLAAAVIVALVFGSPFPVHELQADEGMWLLNDPPRQLLKDKYGFDLTDAWLERAQLASVRFNNGGSGCFVSATGLIVTNHHIGADSLQKLSTRDKDYLKQGFHARGPEDELKCPDLELNVLQSIEDVTARVNAAVKPDMKPAQAFAARRAAMAAVEKESLDKTKLRSDVVTLYQGGLYHLYRYKKYTDVRVVFAPEQLIASFGGDTDNFEFPRYNLDICFFRAYEDGKPVQPRHYLRWSKVGPTEGDLVFVTGHPGSTNRLDTLAKLQHRRDKTLPYMLNRLRMREALLQQFSRAGRSKPAWPTRTCTASPMPARPSPASTRACLTPPSSPARRRRRATSAPKSRPTRTGRRNTATPGTRSPRARKPSPASSASTTCIERGDAFDSELFHIARHLVRLAAEKPKPNADRLREYRESALESLEFQLFSPAPIYPELERAKLAGSLSFLAENLGGEHPLVVKIFAGKAPAARATELINGSKLADPAERKRLFNGGQQAIEAATDPLIRLALLIDPEARVLRKRHEDLVEEIQRQANAKLARARFDLLGRHRAGCDLHAPAGLWRGQGLPGRGRRFALCHHLRRRV